MVVITAAPLIMLRPILIKVTTIVSDSIAGL